MEHVWWIQHTSISGICIPTASYFGPTDILATPVGVSKLKLLRGRFRLAIRFTYPVVPIDFNDLLAALQKYGYKVPKAPPMPIGSGATLEPAGGAIAQMGDITIDADLNRGIVGVESSSSKDMLTAFLQLLEILEKDLQLETSKHTWFVEFVSDLNVEGSKKAIDAIRNAYPSTRIVEVASKVVEEPSGSYGLRFGSMEHDPTEPNWFDMRVEPLVRSSRIYYVSFVYRNADTKRVLRITHDVESKIEQLINAIESEEPNSKSARTIPAKQRTVRQSISATRSN